MFKNALVYRIDLWDAEALAKIEDRLAGSRFVACGASQPLSAGWVEPRGEKNAPLAEIVGGEIILKLCTETKAVPSSVVKETLEQRLDEIDKATGRRPKGKAAREVKEAIVHELLPRAFPKRATTWVWISPRAGLLLIGAASAKNADAVVTRLAELLGGEVRFSALQTQLAPASAMAAWLAEQEAPAGFAIDRECELKQPDSEKAAVRYARHTLEIAEVGEHIRQGKLPTRLAMTWAGRVAFVLTEALAIKKIELLDVVLEGESSAAEDKGFDADVAIVTGELQLMLPDLIAALGGMLDRDQPTAIPASSMAPAPASSAPAADDSIPPWEIAA